MVDIENVISQLPWARLSDLSVRKMVWTAQLCSLLHGKDAPK